MNSIQAFYIYQIKNKHIVSSHLYVEYKNVELIEGESQMVVIKGWWRREFGKLLVKDYKILPRQEK